MKTKIAILVFVSLLLISCVPATSTQENEVVEIATEEIVTEAPTAQELITTEEPIVTEEPTETPIACVTLLTPTNGSEILPVGKVTFSWTPLDSAKFYYLNIILPSGEYVGFQTDKTTENRYMEAFANGGVYRWSVTAFNIDKNEICVSEVATFDKSAYSPLIESGGGNGNEGNNGGIGGSGCDPLEGCQGNP